MGLFFFERICYNKQIKLNREGGRSSMVSNNNELIEKNNQFEIDEFVSNNYDLIWTAAYCLTNRSRDSADEITQEVFLLLVKKWDSLKKDNIKAWLLAATRNKALEYFRTEKKQRGGITIPIDSEVVSEIPTFDSSFDLSDNEIQKIKKDLLRTLTEEERQLYNAYYEKKFSYDDIVKLYSLPLFTARSKIWRIKNKLYKELMKKGLLMFTSSVALGHYLTIITAYLFNSR